MTDVLHGTGRRYRKLAASQDLIGWRRFMEGIISKEILVIQQEYLDMKGTCSTPTTPTSWAKGLIICLVEITHGQWLYQNFHVHGIVTGFHATRRKEGLQKKLRIKFIWGDKDWRGMINTYWRSIFIWRLHPEKYKNNVTLPYKLHERQGYYEIVK